MGPPKGAASHQTNQRSAIDPFATDQTLSASELPGALALVLANVLVVAHAAFLAFVLGGALLVLRWPRLWKVHLGCAAWGLFIEVTRFTCPLTTLEKWLRIQAGDPAYSGGFFEQYIVMLVLPDGLPRPVQTSIVLALTTLTVVSYYRLGKRGALAPVRVERVG